MAILAVIGKNMTGPYSFKDSTNAIVIGSAADTGAWTVGSASGLGTAAAAYHVKYGSEVSRITSASGSGVYSGRTAVYFASNYYIDGSGNDKAVLTGSGTAFMRLTPQVNTTSAVVAWVANSTAQTADTALAGTSVTIGNATSVGQWFFRFRTMVGPGDSVLSGTGNSPGVYTYMTSGAIAYIDSFASATANSELRIRVYNNGPVDGIAIGGTGAITVGTANAALTHTFFGSATNFNGGTQTSNGINISYSSGNTLSITGNTGAGMFAGWSIYANNSSTFLAIGSNNNQIRFYTGSFAGTQVGTIANDGSWTIGPTGSATAVIHSIHGQGATTGTGYAGMALTVRSNQAYANSDTTNLIGISFLKSRSGNTSYGGMGVTNTLTGAVTGSRLQIFVRNFADAGEAIGIYVTAVSSGAQVQIGMAGDTATEHAWQGGAVASATAGAASALPGNPAGYLQLTINGTSRRIPYYNA